MVVTQRWTEVQSKEDIQKNVQRLYNVFRKLSKSCGIKNVIVVVDPIYKFGDFFYVHYNVVWDGNYIPKKRIEDLWGYHTYISFRNKRKSRHNTPPVI